MAADSRESELAAAEAQQEEDADGEQGLCQDEGGGAPAAETGEAAGAGDWKTVNKQRRQKAGLFVCVPDLTERFVCTAICLRPSMNLLFSAFKLASAGFEEEQERLLYHGQQRTFRVLETARGKLINKCWHEVEEVMGQCPLALPWAMRTCSPRSILFRSLSSLLCNITAALKRYHAGFPYQLFRILDGNEAAQEVYSIPVCMRDELSSKFFELYPSDQEGTSEPALAVLQSLATMVEVEP